ncbi:MAG: GreA/GreB family elongation factor [Kiritimatiellae bacterium]|nr:GreA/GreB family elongation factor [Kiritimatiellia bacterium]
MSQSAPAVSPNDLAVQIVTEAFEPSPDAAKLLDLMGSLADLVKNEKDERRLEPRDQAFAVVEQCFIDRRDVASLITLLHRKAKWTGDRVAYGAECLSVLSAAASKDRLAMAKIESAGFGKIRPSEALKRLSLLLSLKPGSVVAHRTWGYGVVKAEDDYYKNMTVEFDDAPGRPKALGFSFAAEALVPIGAEHVLAARHADRAGFDALCLAEPGRVAKMALQSWGNLTVSQLQARIEPILPAGQDWKQFWELARKQLARDAAVRLPAATKKAEAVELSAQVPAAAGADKAEKAGKDDAGKADKADEAKAEKPDAECAAFVKLRDPKAIFEKGADFAKRAKAAKASGGTLSDAQRAALADRIGFVLKASVADRKKLGNAAKVRAAMLGLSCGLAEVPVALRPGAEEDFAFAPGSDGKSVDLLRTLCRTDIALDAAASLPASLTAELAGWIPLDADPAVAADFLAVLPDMPANLMEHAAPRLATGVAKADFAKKLHEEIGKTRPSFQLLRWLCHAAAGASAAAVGAGKDEAADKADPKAKAKAAKALSDAVLEAVPPFALVSIVAVALDGEAAGEALRMKNDLKKLFVAGRLADEESPDAAPGANAKKAKKKIEVEAGSKWLVPLMDRMSREERASVFARLSAMEGVWEPLKKRNLLEYLRADYEGIEELPEMAEEAPEAFVRFGITSARSYAERQARLDKLVKEDIPQNIRDIEFAKGFGDLSENFEYQTARDRERELQARQTQLQKDLASVSAFDFSGIAQNGLAGVGSFVAIRGEDGAERAYSILGEWDSDPDLGIVSSRSRVAEALFGHAEGDKVEMPGEDGETSVATVVSVGPLPDAVLAWARG